MNPRNPRDTEMGMKTAILATTRILMPQSWAGNCPPILLIGEGRDMRERFLERVSAAQLACRKYGLLGATFEVPMRQLAVVTPEMEKLVRAKGYLMVDPRDYDETPDMDGKRVDDPAVEVGPQTLRFTCIPGSLGIQVATFWFGTGALFAMLYGDDYRVKAAAD